MLYNQLPSGIYGFMHIAVMGNWKEIVEEQLQIIESSGLRRETNKIIAGITGVQFDEEYYLSEHPDVRNAVPKPFSNGLEHYLKYGKNEGRKAKIGMEDYIDFLSNYVDIIYYDSDLKKAEKFTLLKLHRFANLVSNSKFWYIHTKGASRPNEKNVYYWRKYMEYFVVEKYRDCVAALDEYEACGTDWLPSDKERFAKGWGISKKKPVPNIFAGNFWWARSDYIRKIDTKPLIEGDYFASEHAFIGMANPKAKSMHNSYCNLYSTSYPPERYKSA